MENAKSQPNTSGGIYGSFGNYQMGIAAQATTTFLQLASIFTQISNMFGELFMDQTDFQQTAAKASADATEESTKDQAWSTVMSGIGTAIAAVFQLGGSIFAYNSYSNAAPEDPNLDLAKQYQKACVSPNTSLDEMKGLPSDDGELPEGTELTVFKSNVTEATNSEEPESEVNERIKALKAIKNIEEELLTDSQCITKTGSLSTDEKAAIQTMNSDDQASFKKQIDDYISNKLETRNSAINAAANRAQPISQAINAAGNTISGLAAKPAEAYFQYAAGKQQALMTMANAALSLAQNSAEQERSKADTFQQTASSEFDKLAQILQAETSSQG